MYEEFDSIWNFGVLEKWMLVEATPVSFGGHQVLTMGIVTYISIWGLVIRSFPFCDWIFYVFINDLFNL